MSDPGRNLDLAQLRSLDPAAAIAVDDATIELALRDLKARVNGNQLSDPESVSGSGVVDGDPRPAPIALSRPGHSRSVRRRAVLAAAALVAAAIATTLAAVNLTGTKATHSSTAATSAAVVRQLAPLLTTATTSCGGISGVPVDALAGPTGAETQKGAEGNALRAFLVDNPWGWDGTVPRSGWALLSDTGGQLVFGIRQGQLGVGRVVTFRKTGGEYQPQTLDTGCQGVVLASGEATSAITAVAVEGNSLTITWVASYSPSCAPASSLVRVEVALTTDALHLLAVVKRPLTAGNDVAKACSAPPEPPTIQMTTVKLNTPLGVRVVYDDNAIPPSPVATHVSGP